MRHFVEEVCKRLKYKETNLVLHRLFPVFLSKAVLHYFTKVCIFLNRRLIYFVLRKIIISSWMSERKRYLNMRCDLIFFFLSNFFIIAILNFKLPRFASLLNNVSSCRGKIIQLRHISIIETFHFFRYLHGLSKKKKENAENPLLKTLSQSVIFEIKLWFYLKIMVNSKKRKIIIYVLK